jgi:hypothetical protein
MPRETREERASALRRKIRALETERASCLQTVLEVRNLFAASLSTVYRTCGKQRCACARGKLHGPYFFLSIQSGGRNDRYHLSQAQVQKVQPALDRYRLFLKTLRRLRSLDRHIERELRRLQSLCESRSVKSFTTS